MNSTDESLDRLVTSSGSEADELETVGSILTSFTDLSPNSHTYTVELHSRQAPS